MRMAPVVNYLNKVVKTLGVQAARNMKTKGRNLVSIPELVSGLKAFKNKSELSQLKSSVNYLIDSGLVKLILPEAIRKTFAEVGLAKKSGRSKQAPLGATQLCGGGCDVCCRPRLSVGVVYGADGLPINQLGCGPCGSGCGTCGPCGGGGSCGSCCGDSCRPRLSIGVVYPQDVLNQLSGNPLNQLAGSCGSCCDSCRPRLSVGVVYPNAGLNGLKF